jgi:hypothetical protein
VVFVDHHKSVEHVKEYRFYRHQITFHIADCRKS